MRILMISPHPVYAPRGTPISVFNRCAALSALGHEVDLVTYPIGDDVPLPGLRYLRAATPGVKRVAVGPSWAKIPLNAAVAARAVRAATASGSHYDVIHSHEEAGPVGAALARISRVPHVYDMGNDWATVLQNYGLRSRHPLTLAARRVELGVVRASAVVIAHFPSIATGLADRHPGTPVEVVFNAELAADPSPEHVARVRSALSPDGSHLLLYTGTLEPYQGIDILLEAIADVRRSGEAPKLVVIGGTEEQRDRLRLEAARNRIEGSVHVHAPVPPSVIPACLRAADVLISPRLTGSNTPLKIFAYLRAGRPILATDIKSHTQVLDPGVSMLVPPTATGLASGIRKLVSDSGLRSELASAARARAERYGPDAYVRGVAAAYARVGARSSPELVDSAVGRLAATTAVPLDDLSGIPDSLRSAFAAAGGAGP